MNTEFHIVNRHEEILETFVSPMAPRCGDVLRTQDEKQWRVDAVHWNVGALDGSISVSLWCSELDI